MVSQTQFDPFDAGFDVDVSRLSFLTCWFLQRQGWRHPMVPCHSYEKWAPAVARSANGVDARDSPGTSAGVEVDQPGQCIGVSNYDSKWHPQFFGKKNALLA